jgi:predicted nucleic acid-binding protein
MVSADTSSIIALFDGEAGADVAALIDAFSSGNVILSPIVLTELLSEQSLAADQAAVFEALPLFDITDGFWIRAAASRKLVLSKKLRARLPDTLIAQSCIDHDVALITRDGDFRHFAKHCGLKLA